MQHQRSRADIEKNVRQRVRKGTGQQMRRMGVLYPSYQLAKKYALRQAVIVMREPGMYLPENVVATIASDTAKYIADNWDLAKARPPARTPRSERQKSKESIIKLASGEGALTTRRGVADQLGFSKTQVQTALVSAGLSRPWEKKKLSSAASRILLTLSQRMPPDAKRIFDCDELLRSAHVKLEHGSAVFREINNAGVSTTVLETGTKSCRGATWVVVAKGRRPADSILMEWFLKIESARKQHRNPLQPDQRKYCLGVIHPTPGLEERDLSSVLAVLQGSRHLSEWRRFLEASIPAGHRGELIDREAIVTVIQSALRLSEKSLLEASPFNWIHHKATRAAGQNIFMLLSDPSLHGMAVFELLHRWREFTGLEDRLLGGGLPGRRLERFDQLFSLARCDVSEFLDHLNPALDADDPAHAEKDDLSGWEDVLPSFLLPEAEPLFVEPGTHSRTEDELDLEGASDYKDEYGYVWPHEDD